MHIYVEQRVQYDAFCSCDKLKWAVNVFRPVKRRTCSKQFLHQITFRQSTKRQKKNDGRERKNAERDDALLFPRPDKEYRTHGNSMRAAINEKKQN